MRSFIIALCILPVASLRLTQHISESPKLTKDEDVTDEDDVILEAEGLISKCPMLKHIPSCKKAAEEESCMDYEALLTAVREFDALDFFEEHCALDNPEFNTDVVTNNHKKPMIFMHIHKGAGVLICHGARKNEKVIQPSAVCGAEDDNVKLIGKGHEISCKQRKNMFARQGATFGMIERELNEGDLCPEDFDYGIALRDPMALAESMTNFDRIVPDHGAELPHDSWEKHLACLDQGREACKKLKTSITGLYNFYDNYLVRILGGHEVFSKDPGTIDKNDVQKAIDRLEKFNVVFTFNSPADLPKLTKTLGWNYDPGGKDLHKHPHEYTISREGKAKIRERLWADYEVYNHFANKEQQ